MVARLTVILFILVCLEAGLLLTLLPWISDWGTNVVLIYFVDVTGLRIVETVITSGWFKGAVTGLGIFNLLVGFWEIAHFSKSVEELEAVDSEITRARERK
ncbi:MAG: hypothetical protein DWQ47_06030 [Acidobacteria bacterium]|nr:MAG: hypothetical protein DWQ32_09580 [Acidobacteriota bacterium]REK01937.1 MAG: hypothetical protein DWQ38_06015 [Acidobacteriota bacterium]REK14893.1 MAG: hypothetical protein DWQ43_15270 [Acidobacteriota bacterium]REK45608.1 MAG: hypothetical protein DWQ47_06030 [Acidobacteriota bacterium]